MKDDTYNTLLDKHQNKIKVYRGLLAKAKKQDWGFLKENGDWTHTSGLMCSYGSYEFSESIGLARETIRPIIKTFIDAGIISKHVELNHPEIKAPHKHRYSIIYINKLFDTDDELLEFVKIHIREHGNSRTKQFLSENTPQKSGVNEDVQDISSTPQNTPQKSGVNISTNNPIHSTFSGVDCTQSTPPSNDHSILVCGVNGMAPFTPHCNNDATIDNAIGTLTSSLTGTQMIVVVAGGYSVMRIEEQGHWRMHTDSIIDTHLKDNADELMLLREHIDTLLSDIETEQRQQKRALAQIQRTLPHKPNETPPDEYIEQLKDIPALQELMEKVATVARIHTRTRKHKDAIIDAENEQRINKQQQVKRKYM